jgi:hypothetical protein
MGHGLAFGHMREQFKVPKCACLACNGPERLQRFSFHRVPEVCLCLLPPP